MRFTDYSGPTGAYVALGEGRGVVPLTSVQGAVAFGYSAMMSSAGPGEAGKRWQEGMERALDEARLADQSLGA